jgi:hypothetical protein
MPTPLSVKEKVALAVIVNGLAPALNTMPLTSVLAEMKGALFCDLSNVAVSAGPLGTVIGVQFRAVFQFSCGANFLHVALPAKLLLVIESSSSNIVTTRNGGPRCGRREGTATDIDEERHMLPFVICLFQRTAVLRHDS